MLEIPQRLVAEDTEKALRNITAMGAALFACAYGVGFVIVTMHHAAYGFFEFSLFRPRIFAAGLAFLVLTALPLWVARRLRNRIVKRLQSDVPEHGAKQTTAWLLESFSESVMIGTFMSQGFRTVYVPYKPPSFGIGWGEGAGFLGVFVVFVWLKLATSKNTRLSLTILTSLFGAALMVTTYVVSDGSRYLVAWFTGVAFLGMAGGPSLMTTQMSQGDPTPDVQNIANMPLWIFIGMTFYSVQIYGRLLPQSGGGLPVPVVVQFTKANFIEKPTSLPTMLIEETEFGYYVTESREAHTAYFIPRDSVSSIQYDRNRLSSATP